MLVFSGPAEDQRQPRKMTDTARAARRPDKHSGIDYLIEEANVGFGRLPAIQRYGHALARG